MSENLTAGACPWDSFPHAYLDFCEENVCGLLKEPANSWSCLGFVLVGLYLWRKARKEGADSYLTAFGPIAILVGVFSVALHGTLTRVGSFLDLTSMYLFASLLLIFNLARLGWVPPTQSLPIFLGVNLATGIALVLHDKIGVPIFALELTAVGFAEIALWRTGRLAPSYRWFWITVTLFFTGLGIWALDLSRVLCAPTNHWLQGHAYWHLSSAACFYTFYRFYSQFRWDPGTQSRTSR